MSEDPFEAFDSAAEVLGFIWRKLGESGLHECLAGLADDSEFPATCEFLQQAADDLALVGLRKASAIVSEAAAAAPPDPRKRRWRSASALTRASG